MCVSLDSKAVVEISSLESLLALGSKAVVEISFLESLLALCVGLSLSMCVCLSQRDLRRN